MSADLRFRTVWRVAAEPEAVRVALEDVPAYPQWWPSVVEATPELDDESIIAIRGPLPRPLRVRLTRMDAADGVLAARMRGDVLGWCSWHISPSPAGGTRAVFQEHVMLQRRSLRALARVAPKRLRTSHAAIMRAGETGLQALLES